MHYPLFYGKNSLIMLFYGQEKIIMISI
jgi:hypothetical protein